MKRSAQPSRLKRSGSVVSAIATITVPKPSSTRNSYPTWPAPRPSLKPCSACRLATRRKSSVSPITAILRRSSGSRSSATAARNSAVRRSTSEGMSSEVDPNWFCRP